VRILHKKATTMGAPRGHLNALRTGEKLKLSRLIVGKLPKKMLRVQRSAQAYRRQLEAAVIERHGEVGVVHAHLVDTATAAELHSGICRWLLREKLDTMPTADVLACSSQILKSKEVRDRALKCLDLEGQPADDGWQTLQVPVTGSPEAISGPDGTEPLKASG
jgi:hypothetical protein